MVFRVRAEQSLLLAEALRSTHLWTSWGRMVCYQSGKADLSKVWYWQVVFLSSKASWAPCRDIVAMPKGARPISILGIRTISILSLSMASERIVSNKRLLLCFFFCSVYLMSPSIVRWGWTTNSPRPWARTCEMWGSNGLKRRRRKLSLELAMLGRTLKQTTPFTRKIGAMKRSILPYPAKPVGWEQWCGIVVCARPESLLLRRLRPEPSERRAPGPGAIRQVKLAPLASKHLMDRKLILHTDAAKSYKTKARGVLHWQRDPREKTCESERQIQMASTCLCSACQARLPQDAEDCGGEIWYHDCGSGMWVFKI